MGRSKRLWWGFLTFWLLLLGLNVLFAREGQGFWLRVASELLGVGLAVVNLVRVRRRDTGTRH